ncbi:MAG: hypothetical protein U1F57_10495 [bacterium]
MSRKIFSISFRSTAMVMFLVCFLFSPKNSFGGEVKGTLNHPKGTVVLKYAYFIKGPDSFDSKKMIDRVLLSGNDLTAKIQACKTMSCVDGELTEGLEVDLVSGPRYNYWMAINGAKVQYSGTLQPSVLKTTAKDAKRIAGKLTFDDTVMTGPKVEADFDATLSKEFTQAR